MIPTSQRETTLVHPLARFVTKEAIALLLDLKPENIYRIDCWRYVIHVIGKGVSTFISYADLPPILGVPPNNQDFGDWRKRWKKNQKKQAPEFWVKFYEQKFAQALSVAELYAWGQLVRLESSWRFLQWQCKDCELFISKLNIHSSLNWKQLRELC